MKSISTRASSLPLPEREVRFGADATATKSGGAVYSLTKTVLCFDHARTVAQKAAWSKGGVPL